MPPTAVVDTTAPADVIADLKAKVNGTTSEQSKGTLADNYMYDFQYNHSLPTIDALGTKIGDDVDATKVAEELTASLSKALGAGDAQAFTSLFLEYGESGRVNA